MTDQILIDKSRVEIKVGDYGVTGATALADPSLHPRVQGYRRQTGARMVALDRSDIRKRIPSAEYHVSRKVDGEFTVLVYRNKQAFTLNPGGTVRLGMPWQNEAVQLLAKGGIKEALVVGELYVERADGRRPRVHDVVSVARQPESAKDLDSLRFAVFDIMSLNGQPPSRSYAETWQSIEALFGNGTQVHPVEARTAKDAESIEKIFHQWVEQEEAEGVVIRSDTAGVFKIKPRHTLDLAVIGFTESLDERQGLLHDVLAGVMRNDGTLQVLTRVGGGFDEDERRNMLSDLKDMAVESEYAEVNADHVAYQMVRPDWVIEVSCLDIVSQTTRGGPVNRMVLDWDLDGSGRYNVVRRLPLASVISPQFVRRRDDKSVQVEDVRVKQLADLVEIPLCDRDARQLTLPKSQTLRREVYTKQAKGETMVRKFVMWKTNKETQSDDYPAYVVHYTDFSPNRKAPLARDVRVSTSLEQIQAMWDGFKESNIKKGWELHSGELPSQASTEEFSGNGNASATKPTKPKGAVAKQSAPKKKRAAKKTGQTSTKTTAKRAASARSKKKATKKKTG
jgi:hypothetical protein